MPKIRIAIAGIGNCASSLVQGIHYYGSGADTTGLLHPFLGGYRVEDLIAQVKHILGTDKTWNVLLIGAGNLGRALMSYRGFDAKGFRLVAVFDSDPAKIGKRQGPFSSPQGPDAAKLKRFFVIQPLSELKSTVEKLGIRFAILAVPADAAQELADQCVESGIRGLLNFAPVSLNVGRDIALNSVDLAVQLEQLSFQVNFSPLIQM